MFLLQRCVFNAVGKIKALESRVPLLPNLKIGIPSLCSNSFCSATKSLAEDATVKEYLNHLVNAHQNGNVKSEGISEILKIRALPVLLNEKLSIIESLKNLEELVREDEEMKKLAKEEEVIYEQQLRDIDRKILEVILENLSEENYDNVIVEILPGVGGQEAMLFAKDLLEMYTGHLDYLGLDYDMIDFDENELGGIRKAVMAVTSSEGYKKLKYEGGVHRVQRIPATERSGRLHTSTATVVVLPEPKNIEIELDEKDLKIESKRASGAGGQHVNTTDSAIRITHLPTGIAVNCQIGKSQHQNKKWALMKLRSILYDQQSEKQTSFISRLRKKQMGMKSRNEKIRTYNYNQDRVTDHRIANGTTHSLKMFMKGGQALEELEDKLQRDMQQKILLEIVQRTDSELKQARRRFGGEG
ncbi:mitochondrial translation release factor 1 isoform X1 [Halictus rubicundus]|uniref:mitochondrial translation release factor 1 isoform X1 n=2 Tax=Halictus rubicundus TaxID=77578 RepID=UPI004036794C